MTVQELIDALRQQEAGLEVELMVDVGAGPVEAPCVEVSLDHRMGVVRLYGEWGDPPA